MKQEILDHMIAANQKWRELEQAGYHSGGWDPQTDQTAIFKGKYPNATLAGYMDRKTLAITWIDPPVSPIFSEYTHTERMEPSNEI